MTTIIWFTGLSGSGKTTIAYQLKYYFERLGNSVYLIDGDEIRKTQHKSLGFSREDIRENNRLIAELCRAESSKFDFILVPIISPYLEDREYARSINKNFILLYLCCPLAECIRRDVKGLYKKAIANKITNFIGVHDSNPYQAPTNADIKIDTSQIEINETVDLIINRLNELQIPVKPEQSNNSVIPKEAEEPNKSEKSISK